MTADAGAIDPGPHSGRAPHPAATAVTGQLPCDILLIQPPIRDYYLTAKRTIPYGLMSMAAALRQNGFRVAVLDALARGKSRPVPLPDDLGHLAAFYGAADQSPFALFHTYRHFGYALTTIAESARRSEAFLIGVSSLFSAYEDMALACAQAVKTACPGAHIVMGGHHPTAFPHRILDHPNVDYVLRGDGEAGLPQLAKVLRRGGDLASVPGLSFVSEDGRRHIGAPAYVQDLDRLALPAADLADGRYYNRSGRASLVVAASRGCPLDCSYCCMGRYAKGPYRRRSVDHVMREIVQAAERRDIGLIDFEDEHLALDRGWFADLLHRLIDYFGARPPELRAMNGLFPPSLDRELILQMRTAGFRELNLSLASSDRRQIRRFHRPDVTQGFDRALAWAAQAGMTAVGYLLAGAPGQDPLSSVDDLLFLASRRVLVGLSIFYPAPNSLDFERCRREGLLPASPLVWRSSALPIDHTTRRKDSLTLLRLARILNFMKQCRDEDGAIPAPQALSGQPPRLSGTRSAMGRHLLRWFLSDGIVRGVDPGGRVFPFATSARLVKAFRQGLGAIEVQGVRAM